MRKYRQIHNARNGIFLLLCFFTYFIWALVIPYNSAPDEHMRMQLVTFINATSSLPNGNNASIRDATWGFSYAYLPYLSQIVSALFVKLISFFSSNQELYYFFARIPGVIFSTLSVWLHLKMGGIILKSKAKWIYVTVIAFLPQFVYLSSYINNESLSFLSVSSILYSWLMGQKTGWSLRNCIWLGISISICALTYYNAYGFILFSVPFFVISYYRHYQGKFQTRQARAEVLRSFFLRAGLIVILVALLSGWWFIRNYLLYGDFTGLKAMLESGELYGLPALKPSNRQHPQSLIEMFFALGWLKFTYLSFIGYFGYMTVPLSLSLYTFYTLIFLVGISNYIITFREQKCYFRPNFLFEVFLFLSAATSVILSIYNSYTSDNQPQGRYIIYMLIPLSLCIAKGFIGFQLKIQKMSTQKLITYLFCFIYIYYSYFCFFNFILHNTAV